MVLSLDEHHTITPYFQGAGGQDQAQVSPDGNWVAYTSNEAVRNEVFVQSFPSPGIRYPVSTGGGMQPRWRGDGKELFYMAPAGQVGIGIGRVMAVSVQRTATALRLGDPTALFDSYVSVAEHQGASFNYAVTADGQRFLVARQRVLTNSNPAATPLTVVLNWTSALPQR
jgi:Tol biopolymer transport system component